MPSPFQHVLVVLVALAGFAVPQEAVALHLVGRGRGGGARGRVLHRVTTAVHIVQGGRSMAVPFSPFVVGLGGLVILVVVFLGIGFVLLLLLLVVPAAHPGLPQVQAHVRQESEFGQTLFVAQKALVIVLFRRRLLLILVLFELFLLQLHDFGQAVDQIGRLLLLGRVVDFRAFLSAFGRC